MCSSQQTFRAAIKSALMIARHFDSSDTPKFQTSGVRFVYCVLILDLHVQDLRQEAACACVRD